MGGCSSGEGDPAPLQALGPEQDSANSWSQGCAAGAGQIHGTCIPVSHPKILGGVPPQQGPCGAVQPRSGCWSRQRLCGSGGAEAAVLAVGMAGGASKLVSPYVLPEKAAPLHAEAVLQRLLRRLSQDQAGATLGPSTLLPSHCPPSPYIKYLLVPNAVSVLLCPCRGQAAASGENWPCDHPYKSPLGASTSTLARPGKGGWGNASLGGGTQSFPAQGQGCRVGTPIVLPSQGDAVLGRRRQWKAGFPGLVKPLALCPVPEALSCCRGWMSFPWAPRRMRSRDNGQ